MSWRINGLSKVFHRVFSGSWNGPVSKLGNLGLAQLQSLPSFAIYVFTYKNVLCLVDSLYLHGNLPTNITRCSKSGTSSQHFQFISFLTQTHVDLTWILALVWPSTPMATRSHHTAQLLVLCHWQRGTCDWVSKQLRKKRSSQLQIVADSWSILEIIWIWILRQNVSYSSNNLLYTIVITCNNIVYECLW